MSKYEKMEQPSPKEFTEWWAPQETGWKMGCCDCGLVHDVDFRVVQEGEGPLQVQMRMRRNIRSTAAKRSHNFYPLIDK